MTDLLAGRRTLAEFKGLVACGGFSYGDVLGAGEGWAKSILFHEAVRDEFARFFARTDTFALGICNGCQMFAALQEHHPRHRALAALRAAIAASSTKRASRMVEILQSPSVRARGHGGLVPADRDGARRGARGFASAAAAAGLREERPGGLSLRQSRSHGRHDLSGQSRAARPSASRRSPTPTAASPSRCRTRSARSRYVQNSWRPRRCGRVERLDAPVPQRAPLRRLRCFSSRR